MSSTLSIHLLLSSILLFSVAAPAASDVRIAVRDTDGDVVRSGSQYQIIGYSNPASNGEGLHLLRLPESQCRHKVKLAPSQDSPAVLLFPEGVQPPPKGQIVNVNENLAIASLVALPGICDSLWRINAQTGLVIVGESLPWSTERNNQRFRIVRHGIDGEDYYELLSCPVRETRCSTIGRTEEQLLGRSTPPLLVQFQKVPKPTDVFHAMA